jgi:four helix bundle protein
MGLSFGEELEDRCLRFSQRYGRFCRSIKKDFVLLEYCKQGVRSSSSVGANYIEANESLSSKDFILRAKICRKEAKESRYWLRLIKEFLVEENELQECNRLIQEAKELISGLRSLRNASSS